MSCSRTAPSSQRAVGTDTLSAAIGRPARSLAVSVGLLAAVAEVSADEALSAGVLIGAGKKFVAGADLREFSAPLVEPQLPEVIAAIETCPKPIVAALHGRARWLRDRARL
jgi:enoyl-CoA hydratase/carnithine racemase